MIEKNCENPSKSNSSKILEENGIEIPNFKLFYNEPNPERDKSSGVSSDDETTSSSLVPIPNNLKHLKHKMKWTLSDNEEHSEVDNTHVCGVLGKSAGNMVNSLEELRKKYTLKNEASVALKMNSANLMLDDILSSTNLNNSLKGDSQSKFFKKEEFRERNENTESETTSTIETRSTSHPQSCTHILDHPHHPVALDFFSKCHGHCSAAQHMYNPKEKDIFIPKINLDNSQRKKSLMEKLQDLRIRYRLQSVYKNLQKTRNPFTKISKNFENDVKVEVKQQVKKPGTLRSNGQEDVVNETEPACKCNCPLNRYPKKMVLDLIECSETSRSETKSTERMDRFCTCTYQRNCDCPEIIPQCFCVQHVRINSKNQKGSSLHSDPKENNERKEIIQSVQTASPRSTRNENETNSVMEKENQKSNPQSKNIKEGWRHCTKEKKLIERTDIYYFDHGNSAYYKTTDNHPIRYTECLVERTDEYATKFWAEFFGTIEIGVAFLISFILQLYRFLFTSIIRSLTVGLLQIFSDYFFKPLLTILFNGIIQPCLILAYNIATSLRDLCLPISEVFGFFAKEIANILRSCRLVDINHDRKPSCYCGNKV